MFATQVSPDNDHIDRRALAAATVIACLALIMLVLQFVGKPAEVYASPLFWVESLSELSVAAALAFALPMSLREMRQRRDVAANALRSQTQVETLFQMTDMLQSALGYADANAVLRSTAAKLLPGLGGVLYVFNNSGDRLEMSTSWDWPADSAPAETISPTHCWALKRGKSHFNRRGASSLLCEHHPGSAAVLEMPMMARGEVYGLLGVTATGDKAEERLEQLAPIAGALSDAMSLALANIALRDKLRTQALRDPLTGLYNRRYMEDALERYANLAERNENALSVVMIDLDHFKRLNDEHGHALGDAVLAEVASTIVGAIRPCDIACRYGGEELVVLLPDCSLAEAAAKAELLRGRIERLSENHGTRVSASFGVATVPESSSKASDALSDADAALYRAKSEGRNRVISATHRGIRKVVSRDRDAA
jgi:diguanylate cyclase (GGDEF)-like protein